MLQTQHTSNFKWRVWLGLAVLVAINLVVAFALTNTPQVALAQDGGGQQDDKGVVPVFDYYPEPFAGGAMAYSLRDPWDKTDLTYYFHNCPSQLDCQQAREAIRQSFHNWELVSALVFTEVADVSEADIEVTWTDNDPDGVLGQPGGVLAYNYFPRYGGDMFIDDTEPWTIGDQGEFDLILAATHEIGHGIGLDHSEFTDAIMYAYAGFAKAIGPDDIAAIQSLYGPPAGQTPSTTDNPSNVDEPEGNIPTASNENVQEVEGSLDNNTYYEIWTLNIEAGTTATVTMRATGGNLDPLVGILTEDLSEVLVENDNWVGKDARVVYTFAEAGTFSVVATRYGLENGSTSGTYNLTAEFSSTGSGTDPTNNNAPPAPLNIAWRITNFSETELCKIHFSGTEDTSWGPDQTEGDPLENGFYYQWEIEPGVYDVQVWDCFGNKLEQYNIDASRPVDVQIFANRVSVVPLEDGAETPSSTTFAWRVSNYSGFELCNIYFNAAAETTWGDDNLDEGEVLNPNFYFQWQLEPGTYDIRVEDCGSGFLQLGSIELNQDLEIAVYQNEIVTRPLQ
ncbi:MAG: matrixin family metalloprotease [Anaerolineales bacterium]|nr:matrixin family metalloprotease [Anaerolineales bacterium]